MKHATMGSFSYSSSESGWGKESFSSSPQEAVGRVEGFR